MLHSDPSQRISFDQIEQNFTFQTDSLPSENSILQLAELGLMGNPPMYEAMTWYQKAAELGHKKDAKKAIMYFRNAENLCHPDAMLNFALVLAVEHSSNQSDHILWFKKVFLIVVPLLFKSSILYQKSKRWV